MSHENITALYENVLFRTPSAAEVAPWANLIDNGSYSLEQVSDVIENSQETVIYVEPIIRLYQGAFGRLPDAAGLNAWVDAMRNGFTFEQIADGFVASQEFNNYYGSLGPTPEGYITALYNQTLGREPTAQEVSDWMATGLNKSQLLIGFINSQEFLNRASAPMDKLIDDLAHGKMPDPHMSLLPVYHRPDPNNPPPPVEPEPPHNPDVVSHFFGDIDASGIAPNGNVYVGTGNTPHNYNGATNETQGVQAALKVHYRTGDDVLPSETINGVAHYTVDTGPQTAGVHNMSSTNVNRAAWSVDFSELVNLNDNGKSLINYKGVISVDVDPTEATHFVTFTQQHVSDGVTPWVMDGGIGGFTDDDGAINTLSQNSFNVGFGFLRSLIDGDTTVDGVQPYNYTKGQFDIRMDIYDAATNVKVVGTGVVVHVVEPAAVI